MSDRAIQRVVSLIQVEEWQCSSATGEFNTGERVTVLRVFLVVAAHIWNSFLSAVTMFVVTVILQVDPISRVLHQLTVVTLILTVVLRIITFICIVTFKSALSLTPLFFTIHHKAAQQGSQGSPAGFCRVEGDGQCCAKWINFNQSPKSQLRII